MGYEYDFVFDWMVKKPTPQQQLRSNDDDAAKEEEKNDTMGNKNETNQNSNQQP